MPRFKKILFGFLVTALVILLLLAHPRVHAALRCSQVFESNSVLKGGIKGKEILTTDPFGSFEMNRFKVLIVDEIPDKPLKTSEIQWLKDPQAHALVSSMIKNNVPLVLGEIPKEFVADAFVLPETFMMTGDVLKAKKDKVHKNILFLQKHSTTDVIAHELQHWLDYEDGTTLRFLEKLIIIKKAASLSDFEFKKIEAAMSELRGHARQEKFLMDDPKTNNPAKLNYVRSLYSPYLDSLRLVLNRMEKDSPGAHKKLLKLLVEFELETQGSLRFSYFFRIDE